MVCSARRPPALGFLTACMVVIVIQLDVYSRLHGRSLAWLAYPDWALFLAFFILLGDRIRREARPGLQLLLCGVALNARRVLQVWRFP